MTDQVPLLASVDRTVADLPTTDADAGIVHLAQLYAQAIDEADRLARFADLVVTRAEEDEDDPELLDLVRALRQKVGQRDTLDRIGARLHAALQELGASPKARAALTGGPAKPKAGASTLHGLRHAQGATA